ncbi:TonB-linked SusC/RagA family outer membrane protein [Pedobacter sp. UYEF25]
MKKPKLIFLILLLSVAAVAQRRVTGTVKDSKTDSPIPGATVMLKAEKRTTQTKSDGKFEMMVPAGKVSLQISYIGYQGKTITINESETSVLVSLLESTSQMNDVVIIGMQRQTRRNTVAAISGISSKDIEDKPVASVDVLLQGRVSGMNVQVNSGQPGATPTIVVRGNSKVGTNIGDRDPSLIQAQSISGPLYVIDGVPIDPADISNVLTYTGTNFLAGININDIQEVLVQKDAAATAAWGSRGANGVIYITTKKGTSKTPIFDVDVQSGITTKPPLLPTLTGAAEREAKVKLLTEYATQPSQLANLPQLLADSLNPYYNNATDWQGLFYRTGQTKQINATMSAASDIMNYRVSMGYYNEDGIIKQTGFQRYSVRGNFGFTINPKFNAQLILGLSRADNQLGQKFYSRLDQANNLNVTPFSGNRQPSSLYRLNEFDINNYLGQSSKLRNLSGDSNYSGSLMANYDILPGLRYTLQGSAIIHTISRDYFRPSNIDAVAFSQDAEASTPSYAESNRDSYDTYLLGNTLNYSKLLETGAGHKHNLNATLTQQFNSIVTSGAVLGGYNTPSNNIQVVSGIPQSDRLGFSTYQKDALLSFIGQLQYDYDGKYLFYGSYRGDGSSRFGANTKWGYFPAFGVGWIASDEKFMAGIKNVVNFLKVRFSYGVSGTQAADYYAPYNSYNVSGTYNGQQAVQPDFNNGLTKNNLTWTKSLQKNLGIELNLFNSRINIVSEFYDKLDRDGIYNFQLPFFTGYNSVKFNARDLWIDNRGIDLSINTRNLSSQSKLQWGSTIILTFNRNRIAKLPNENRTFAQDDYYGISRLYQVGQPIYALFQMQYAGVYNHQSEIPFNPITGNVLTYFKGYNPIQPGYPKWIDANGDGDVWSGEDNGDQFGDRVPTGDPNPKFTGGFSNDFTYKNFSLSIASVFSWKRTVVNTFFQSQIDNIFYGGGVSPLATNRLPDLTGLDYWTPKKALDPNYKANFPSLTPYGGYFYQFFPFTNQFNVDGSYFKVKYVTLSYLLPAKLIERLKIKSASVSAQMANILTIKNKLNTMPDPELVDQFGVYSGNVYPQPKVLTLGLNVKF